MQIRTHIFEKRKDLMEGLSAYISPVDSGWRRRLIPPEPKDLADLQMYLEMQKENSKVLESYFKFACYAAKSDGGLSVKESKLSQKREIDTKTRLTL